MIDITIEQQMELVRQLKTRWFDGLTPGLGPMFYHTFSYEGDMELGARFDAILETLERHKRAPTN